MPNDPVELLPWFRSVEKILDEFKVDKESQFHLLKSHNTASAAAMVARLVVGVAPDFDAVEDAIGLLH
jgi:hypothetical protein